MHEQIHGKKKGGLTALENIEGTGYSTYGKQKSPGSIAEKNQTED